MVSTPVMAAAVPAGSCDSQLGVVSNGGFVTGYAAPFSSPGFPCSSVTDTCSNGVLSGPTLFPSCTNINQDCGGIPDGGSVSGYESAIGPCIMTTVTCNDGALSGPMPSPSCSDPGNPEGF